jgi:PAS domain S-box-containing protein
MERLRTPSLASAALVLVVSLGVTLLAWAAARSAAQTQARSPVELAAALDEQATVVLMSGILISLLVSAMIGMMALQREQAVDAAGRMSLDMQRRERMEQQLRQSELKFRLLFADSPLPMWLYDRETLRFVDVNNAAIHKYGYSHDDFLTMRLTDIRTDEHARSDPAQESRESRHRLRGDRLIEVETMAHDIELGGRAMTLVAINDITERKRAEEQLRQAQKLEAIGHLTGGVAHDFNNLLTVITGLIDILADAVAHDPKLAEVAKMIDDAASRGAELTHDLLAYARRQPLQPRDIELNALVRDGAKLLKPTLGAHIEVQLELAPEPLPVRVDPTQLTTAVLNLALNARDAMPDGGRLTIRTGKAGLEEGEIADDSVTPGRYALLEMSDTGSGIDHSNLEKVFEPFFTTKEIGRGTGLGLSMVYGFVKQSGGHIALSSEAGRGTTVRIYFREAAGAVEPMSPPPLPVLEGGRERILVVEDDPLVRDSVVKQLHALGYDTLIARNGIEAAEIAAAGASFDLLFTDIVMPGGMDGRQLAQELVQARPGLKVLYTSGYSDEAIVHAGRLDPDIALLNKPYRKAELARRIREVLGQGHVPSDLMT